MISFGFPVIAIGHTAMRSACARIGRGIYPRGRNGEGLSKYASFYYIYSKSRRNIRNKIVILLGSDLEI
jgi:hypothetical protein